MLFEKVEYLVSTYKSSGLSYKLPKKNNVYIREFISYLNQLLNNNDDDSKYIIGIILIMFLLVFLSFIIICYYY